MLSGALQVSALTNNAHLPNGSSTPIRTCAQIESCAPQSAIAQQARAALRSSQAARPRISHACPFETRQCPGSSILKRFFCPFHQIARRVHIQMRTTDVLEHRYFIRMPTPRMPAGAQVE